MKNKKLYLDDERTPKTDGWDIVRNYEDFENWITTNGLPDEVSFDHDLMMVVFVTVTEMLLPWLSHWSMMMTPMLICIIQMTMTSSLNAVS